MSIIYKARTSGFDLMEPVVLNDVNDIIELISIVTPSNKSLLVILVRGIHDLVREAINGANGKEQRK